MVPGMTERDRLAAVARQQAWLREAHQGPAQPGQVPVSHQRRSSLWSFLPGLLSRMAATANVHAPGTIRFSGANWRLRRAEERAHHFRPLVHRSNR